MVILLSISTNCCQFINGKRYFMRIYKGVMMKILLRQELLTAKLFSFSCELAVKPTPLLVLDRTQEV